MSNWWDGEVKGETVYILDEVQTTKLLGPDGQPYAIRRQKFKVGFDLTPPKSKNSLDIAKK
jgi:hypothetical protein